MVVLDTLRKLLDPNQRNLTAVYIFALSSIALIAISFQILKFSIHSHQLEAIASIKLVEQQKHFSDIAISSILDTQIANESELDKSNGKMKEALVDLERRNNELIETLPQSICVTMGCSNLFSSLSSHLDSDTNLSSQKLDTYLK